MTDEQRRRGPAATQVQATGQNVRVNVARLRKARGLTTYQLAQLLREKGRPIPQSGVSRIESGARRVDVDDLTALAAVLGVSPAALLLPLTDSGQEPVEVTGGGTVGAADAWAWANGRRPLKLTPGKEQTELLEHQLYGLPQWLRDYRAELNAKVSADFPGRVETDPNTGLPTVVLKRESEGGDDGPSVD